MVVTGEWIKCYNVWLGCRKTGFYSCTVPLMGKGYLKLLHENSFHANFAENNNVSKNLIICRFLMQTEAQVRVILTRSRKR